MSGPRWLVLVFVLVAFVWTGCFRASRPASDECECRRSPASSKPLEEPSRPALPPAPPALKPTPAPGAAVKKPEPPRRLATVRIAAVGDVIAHGDVLRSAVDADLKNKKGKSINHGGFDDLFDGVREELGKADLVFVNLETPIAPRTGRKTIPYRFNAPLPLLQALVGVGVKLVSIANNHVYDQKRKGLVETLDHLDESGLVYAGAGRTCKQARAAKIVEVHGIKLAFMAGSTLYNQRLNKGAGKPCAFEFDEKLALEEVAAARKAGAELVILSLHWGTEYRTAPGRSEIDLAHRLFEGGVDVILGHHPHVLQPVEVYRAVDGRICLVAYSLGNFLSNQSRFYVHGLQPERMGNTRDGAMVRFSAVRKDYGDGLVRTELADLMVLPLWTDNNALDRLRDEKLPVLIRVVVDDRAAVEVQQRLACAEDKKQVLEMKKLLQLYLDRRRIAGRILGKDLLAKPMGLPDGKPECKRAAKADPEPD